MGSEGVELPHEYAPRRVRERLAPWWRGEAGEAVRRHGPAIWPGVPPEALLAWSVTATGPDESGPAPDFVRGLWGVERNKVDELARDARGYLNREVRVGENERYYLRDVEAQAVCGLLNYRRHFEALCEDLPAVVVRAMGRASSMAWRAAAMAYSSGPGVPAAVLGAYGPDLARAAPVEKWPGLLARLVAEHPARTIKHGAREVRVRGKWRAAFSQVRAEQRAVACARLVDEVSTVVDAAAARKWLSCWADVERTLPGAGLALKLKELADDGDE